MANKMPNIKLDGMRELRQAIERLPKELQATVERPALRAGFAPVRKAAQVYAMQSKDSGLLMRSIGLTVKKSRKGGQLTARVGARGGFRQMVSRDGGKPQISDPRNYSHLVEYGTSTTPARPFIRPAVIGNQSRIINEMAKGYAKGMERAVKKIRSRK